MAQDVHVMPFKIIAHPEENIIVLKNLARFHFSPVNLCLDLKRKVICLLEQVFPEYETLFSDVFGVTSKQLLLSFNTPPPRIFCRDLYHEINQLLA